MKKLMLATLIVAMFSNCSTLRQPEIVESSVLDFSKYTERNFFVSESNSVNFEYKPMGSIYALNLSGYEVDNQKNGGLTVQNKKFSDDVYQKSVEELAAKTNNNYIAATRARVLEELCKKAIELGANGIINVKFEALFATSKSGIYYRSGYNGTAMAIKK